MAKVNINSMKTYLSLSISSIDQNTINGMSAEIDLWNTFIAMGFGGRISQGGWITLPLLALPRETNQLIPKRITITAEDKLLKSMN